MINFEIIESPDANVKTSYKYFKNDLYLGRELGDLLIQDPNLLPSQLMIEILEEELLVHPQKGVESYLLNGKRATSIRKVKVGDTIGFGKTVLKILDFSLTPDRTKKTFLNNKLSSMIEKESPRLTVIEKISQMMK
jgi:hypothetical protein